jgi:hypothetical protein
VENLLLRGQRPLVSAIYQNQPLSHYLPPNMQLLPGQNGQVKLRVSSLLNNQRTISAGCSKDSEAPIMASKFPDLSKDGKVTQKDVLMAKGVIPKSDAVAAKKGWLYKRRH